MSFGQISVKVFSENVLKKSLIYYVLECSWYEAGVWTLFRGLASSQLYQIGPETYAFRYGFTPLAKCNSVLVCEIN